MFEDVGYVRTVIRVSRERIRAQIEPATLKTSIGALAVPVLYVVFHALVT